MPPKKRANIGQINPQARRAKLLRAAETPEQRESRLEQQRVRQAEVIAGETTHEYEERIGRQQIRQAQLRGAEQPRQRENRLENDRTRHAQNRHRRGQAGLNLEVFQYDPSYDYGLYPKVTIGKMDKVCEFCRAKKFRTEPPGMCCSNGKVKLDTLNPPPEPLLSYMSGRTSESKHFLQNIRRYNSCFQMTSFGTTATVEQDGGFMPTFKVKGQIYHKVGALLPFPNESPQFLQIYFVGDEQVEANQRCDAIADTRRDIVFSLQRLLHQHNALVKEFISALERMPTDEYKIVIRADRTPTGEHERCFNAPTIGEVAIVIVGEEFDKRDIIIQRRSKALQRIAETHRSYDALQYPIIFWEEEDGYHFNLRQTNATTGMLTNKKVSDMDFYAHRIMIREGSSKHILMCRQLFHQFIVDMYAKVESERLLYIRLNQQKLRVEDYIHLTI
jgi:hypothetical protein